MDQPPASSTTSTRLLALIIGAIGVVYGDIGTSPLYALKEAFNGPHAIAVTHDNVLGVLSLIFWSLIFVVSVKYVVLIMRADNHGEGGIMALMALVQRATEQRARLRWLLMTLGIFGAALFYGDGMITPAISVLSAVEGLEVATPALKRFVIPITLSVLVVLFLLQRHGTARVGAVFGPIMIAWFITLAVLGIISITQYPDVLAALHPGYALGFFEHTHWAGFLVLGAVVLAVTGCEALYADMGHFGKHAIRAAWFSFVLPALVLNYFGQGALLLHTPNITNPFYELAPNWALYPMVALSTCATIIASQAVISGAFSITRQAIQLGYAPRMGVTHTSESEIGQIYIPFMNWGLLVGVLILVIGFQSSSNLAAAYGIAVTGTMAIDTILAFVVVRGLWQWNWVMTVIGIVVFLSVDIVFFSANTEKIMQGGWFPLVIALVMFTLMSTWKRGRALLYERLAVLTIKLVPFVESLSKHPPQKVPGTAIFLTTSQDGVPHALLHNLKHNKILHEHVIVLKVHFHDVPYIEDAQRIQIETLAPGFYRLRVNYGFKDLTDIPRALALCKDQGLALNVMETSFFLSRETLISTDRPGMARWREKLFIGMSRNAGSITAYFNIPTNRVIELGTQVEL
ncbi:MAG: potassium transporter Kup [Gammaproteobacteria bacterium]|nr:potassium transporter Kup [Gammaproteobacteria bacterium]